MRKALLLLAVAVLGFTIFAPTVEAVTVTTPTSVATPNSSWRLWSIQTSRGTFTANVVAINLANPKLHIYSLTGSACRAAPSRTIPSSMP